jgi:hypothetical protein
LPSGEDHRTQYRTGQGDVTAGVVGGAVARRLRAV